MHKIAKKDGYLLVTLQGDATILKFKQAIAEEMATEEYAYQNDIWLLEGINVALTSHDLEDIAYFISTNYPKKTTRTKTALVASSGLSRSFANLWVEMAKALPHQVQVFTTVQEAKDWIF